MLRLPLVTMLAVGACGAPSWEERYARTSGVLTLPNHPDGPVLVDGADCIIEHWDHRRNQTRECVDIADGSCGTHESCSPLVDEDEPPALDGPADLSWSPQLDPNTGTFQHWTVDGGLPPGAWALQGLTSPSEPQVFPGPGEPPSERTTWDVTHRLWGSLLLGSRVDGWMVLEAPTDDQAEFSVVVSVEEGPPCVFLSGVGEYDEGELHWSQPAIVVTTEPAFEATDVWLSVYFPEGAAPGVLGHALLELPTGTHPDLVDELCDELDSAGGPPCTAPCATGRPLCLDARLDGSLEPSDDVFDPAELPACGLDASDPDERFWTCDEWSCGTSQRGSPWPWLVLSLVALRRRGQ